MPAPRRGSKMDLADPKYWEMIRTEEAKKRRLQDAQIYCTTYCNHGHRLGDGRPVDHECRKIPPAALRAEMAGDFELAISLMQRGS